ncbi:MAG: hypothetical protein ACK5LY_03515, partial [Lachnospirales bacterium]
MKFERLELKNFMGLTIDVDFTEITEILAENKKGKTRIYNAISWLFFDKNSNNNAKFEARTLNDKGELESDLITEVALSVVVEGEIIVIGKKFGKTRTYYWNNAPIKKGDFDTRIEDIVSYETLNLLSNVHYFFELSWEKKREILLNTFEIDFSEIDNNYLDVSQLLNIEDKKAELKATIKKVNADLEGIPYKIDVLKSQNKEKAQSFEGFEYEKNKIEEDLENLKFEHRANQNAMSITYGVVISNLELEAEELQKNINDTLAPLKKIEEKRRKFIEDSSFYKRKRLEWVNRKLDYEERVLSDAERLKKQKVFALENDIQYKEGLLETTKNELKEKSSLLLFKREENRDIKAMIFDENS